MFVECHEGRFGAVLTLQRSDIEGYSLVSNGMTIVFPARSHLNGVMSFIMRTGKMKTWSMLEWEPQRR